MKKLLLYGLLYLLSLSNDTMKGVIDLDLLKDAIKEHRNDIAIPIINNSEFQQFPKKYIEIILFGACAYGNIEIVRKLLRFDININASDKYGRTSLFAAVERGHIEIVKLLLANSKVDVNKATHFGMTPLFIAAQEGKADIVELFLGDPRTEINKANIDGVTPLFMAAQEGKKEVVKLFLKNPKTEMNKADNRGITPLHIASANGRAEIVTIFLADPEVAINKAAIDGTTSLYHAAKEGRTEVVALLLADRGTDVNRANIDGITPFYSAVREGHIKVIELFLKNLHTDINKANIFGFTPLYVAVLYRRTEIVKLLLADSRIDISKATIQGITPRYLAIENDYTEIIHLFDRYELIMRLKSDKNILKPDEQLSEISPEAQLLRRTYIDFVYSRGINIEPFNEILFNRLKDKDAIALMKEIFNPDKIARLIIVLAKDEKYGDLVKKALKNSIAKNLAEEMGRLNPEQAKLKEKEVAQDRCVICLTKNDELESDNSMVSLKCCKGHVCADCIQAYDFPEDKCPHCRQPVQLKV
ncbi:MAG TPA: ankyrin repeat domain-containing protein [Candidatus Saccharimonadales bacterium]|nr:ankyrin repeat domain-containing protein [Candidatus Saccharimonadales bacterium]